MPLSRREFGREEFDEIAWEQLACVAIEFKIDPSEIAFTALYPGGAYSRGPDLWKERIAWYKRLAAKKHDGLREIGHEGIKMAEDLLGKEIKEQRQQELDGI